MADQPIPPPADNDPDSQSTPWLPGDELQRAQVLKKANAQLRNDNEKLRWITHDEIDQLAADNEAAITVKRQVAAQRPDQTVTLENVDATCAVLVPELRILLEKKFKKDYRRYYKEFGFVLSNRNWILPYDRDTRRDNIRDLLRPALAKYGMAADVDTGDAKWAAVEAALTTGLNTADTTKRDHSGRVIVTGAQGEKVIKVLRAIIHLVKAQWPDDWEKMLRVYGFLRESN